AKLLRVTEQGAELAQRAIAAVEAADAAFFAPAAGSALLETLGHLADR
ncbi:MAG: MarR family transcriptional regulator, partial [Nonomuraea sp.]|nr:MarR family transcriptional regulator [Nonomuraea sp.]